MPSPSRFHRGPARLPGLRRVAPGALRPGWTREEAESRQLSKRIYAISALVLALAIFALDVLTPLQGAVAVLYTIVVLLVSRGQNRTLPIVAGLLSANLAFGGYYVSHWNDPPGSAAIRLGVSFVAIAVTTMPAVGGCSFA